MGAVQDVIKGVVDTGEQLLRLMRDGLLAGLVVVLLLFPGCINTRLKEAGIQELSPNNIVWKNLENANKETKQAAETITNAGAQLTTVSEALKRIRDETKDEKTRGAITALQAQITATQVQVKQTDDSLKTTVLEQQQALQKSPDAPLPTAQNGWIFVGQVDQGKTAWMKGNPVTTKYVAYPIQEGQALQLDDDIYLRGDAAGRPHTEGRVLAVLKNNTLVTVTKLDWSHAASGGWFVWAQVNVPK